MAAAVIYVTNWKRDFHTDVGTDVDGILSMTHGICYVITEYRSLKAARP